MDSLPLPKAEQLQQTMPNGNYSIASTAIVMNDHTQQRNGVVAGSNNGLDEELTDDYANDVAPLLPADPNAGPELLELSLIGIRSYAPHGIGVEQKLKFSKPLTLILGPNGAGKTTIIEALRFLCSGEVPPGTIRNYAFSYDIKLAKEKHNVNEIRSLARLRFRDAFGMDRMVCRQIFVSLKTVKSQWKIEGRIAESAIKQYGADGKEITCISRIDDINKEVQACLGVSKAVINNVLFCHQEDSFWPLSEGKALKEKFDAIFSAEHYTKALETIREGKKHFSENSIWLTKFEEKAKTLADDVERETAGLEENRKLKADLDAKVATAKIEFEPLEKDVAEADDLLKRILPASHKIESVSLRITQTVSTLEQLTKNVPKEYEGADEKLREEFEQQDRSKEERKRAILEAQNRKMNAEILLRRLRNKETELNKELGARRAQDEQFKETVQDRLNFALQLSEIPKSNLELHTSDSEQRENNFEVLVETLKEHENEATKEVQNLKSQFKEQVLAQRQSLTALEGERAQHEAEIKRCNDKIKHSTQEIWKLERELSEASQDATKRVQLESDVGRQRQLIDEHMQKFNDRELQAQLGQLKSRRKEIQDRKVRCETRLKALQETHQMEQNINGRKKQLVEIDQLRIEKLRRHRDVLVEGGFVAADINVDFMDCVELGFKFNRRVQELEKQKESLEKRRSSVSTEITQFKEQISMLTKRIAEQEKTVQRHEADIGEDFRDLVASHAAATGSQSAKAEEDPSNTLETSLNDAQRQLQHLRDERGEAFGRQFLYKRYVRELSSHQNAGCPLCERHFNDTNQRMQMIARLEHELANIPAQLQGKDGDIEQIDANRTKMLQMLPILKEVDNIKRDIRLKQTEQTLLQTRYEARVKLGGEMNVEHEECAKKLKLLRTAAADISVLSSEEDRVTKLRQDITYQQSQLDDKWTMIQALSGEENLISSASQKTMSQQQQQPQVGSPTAVASYEAKEEELKRLRDEEAVVNEEIDELEKRITDNSQQLRAMQSELSKMQTRLLQTQDRLKAREQKETKKDDLKRENTEHVQLKKLAEEKLPALFDKIAELKQVLNQYEHDCESKVSQHQRRSQRLAENGNKLVEFNAKVKRMMSTIGEDAVTKLEEQLAQALAELRQREEDVQSYRQEVETRSNELKNEDTERRYLEDNIHLRQKRRELEALRADEQQLKEILGDFKISEVQQLRDSKNKQLRELQHVIATNAGRMEELQRSIERSEGKLAMETYSNAKREYAGYYCERLIAQRSVKDCEALYKALDKAILAYHGSKMGELNIIIRELWTSVYRGNDIDYIEIQHELEPEGVPAAGQPAAAATQQLTGGGISGGRRTYNYRVVMIKSGVSLDMRSRCSAGQKVLACLIIRLALAEAFCVKCGIMALDEPTTNLDYENMMKLAEALSALVKARQAAGARNSQLVVITHDEDFLRELNRERFVTNYYKVDRDAQGRSTIELKPFYI